jgi:hypothetical protein
MARARPDRLAFDFIPAGVLGVLVDPDLRRLIDVLH